MSSQTELLKSTNKKLQSELSKVTSSYDSRVEALSQQLQHKNRGDKTFKVLRNKTLFKWSIDILSILWYKLFRPQNLFIDRNIIYSR